METSLIKKITLLASLGSLFFGALGGGLTTWAVLTYEDGHSLQQSTGQTIVNFENGSYKEVYDKAAPAVVSVVALKDLTEYYNQMQQFGPFQFFGMPQQQAPQNNSDEESQLSQISSGSGFIVTADGLVVTNKHVVSDDTAQYEVILNDGTTLDAKVVAKDSLNDIAIVQITDDDERVGSLPTLTFGDSEAMNVGDPVVAIGNALGEYSNTTTVGIISATDRQIVASGGGQGAENLVNLIQTDAAINPGNSGGPLLNLNGEVVGMNTAIDTTASGIGFALPSSDIEPVVKSYQENGHIVTPYVGVRYVPVTETLIQHFKLDVDHGAYVIGDVDAGPGVVPDSPAEKAGLKDGDVILSVDGTDLTEEFSLQNAISSHQVGDTVVLTVHRDGKELQLQVTLEEAPSATK
jgi:serine protease Do